MIPKGFLPTEVNIEYHACIGEVNVDIAGPFEVRRRCPKFVNVWYTGDDRCWNGVAREEPDANGRGCPLPRIDSSTVGIEGISSVVWLSGRDSAKNIRHSISKRLSKATQGAS